MTSLTPNGGNCIFFQAGKMGTKTGVTNATPAFNKNYVLINAIPASFKLFRLYDLEYP